MHLLAEASSALNATLDERRILELLARFAVAEVGDWCAIDLITGDRLERVALAHRDPARGDEADLLREGVPIVAPGSPLARAMETREPQLLAEVSDETLRDAAPDDRTLEVLRTLGLGSGVIVPIVVREEVLGALSIATTRGHPPIDDADIAFMGELAHRAGLALDKARLFASAIEAQERYRSLVENLDAIVFEVDADTGYITFVGPQVERILGSAEITPDVAEALYPSEGPDADVRRKAIAEGNAFETERPVRRSDGRMVWLNIRLYPASDGGRRRLRGLAIDVTERHFRDQQSLMRFAISRALESATDPAAAPLAAMHEILQALGWSAGGLWIPADDEHALVCDAFATAAPDVATEFQAVSQKSRFAPGIGLPGRVWAQRAPLWIEDLSTDGNFPRAPVAVAEGLRTGFAFPVMVGGSIAAVIEMFASELHVEDEGLLHLMEAIGTQIGQYVERRRYEATLRESEARLRGVVEAALDCVIAMAPDGVVLEFNAAAERTFGYSREEAIGQPLADLIVPPSLRERHREGLERYLASGRSTILGQRQELTGMRSDGSEFPVELTVTRLEGTDPMFIGFLRDISERVATDQRRRAQFAVTSILSSSTSFDEATAQILETLGHTLNWQAGALWVPDPMGTELRCRRIWHASDTTERSFAAMSERWRFRLGQGLPGRVWESREPMWIQEILDNPRFERRGSAAASGLRSTMMIPVVHGDQMLAIFEFFSTSEREPDEDLLRTLGALGRQIGGFIERTQGADQLRLHRAILASQSEASIEGALLVSTDGAVLSRNRRFDELFGIDARTISAMDGEALLSSMTLAMEGPAEAIEALTAAAPRTEHEVRRDVEIAGGKTYEIYTVPVHGNNGEPLLGRAWYVRDVSERVRTERLLRSAGRRAAFVAEASTALMRSLDVGEMLTGLARRIVPAFGDVCVIDTLDRTGRVERLASVSRGPVPDGIDGSIDLRQPVTAESAGPIAAVLARGATELIRAGEGTAVIIPMTTLGRLIGTISLFASGDDGRLDEDTIGLLEDVAWRAALAADTARLYTERTHVARTLQDSLLPPELPTIKGIEVVARYEPAAGDEVGGDFYDVFETGRNDWAFVVGDVLGKGAEAAALTALTRYTIRAAAMSARKPKLVLEQLNEAIRRHRGDDRFATVAYARLRRSKDRWRLTLALGGHPHPMLLKPDGTVHELGARGTLLGVFDEVELTDHSTTVEPGDILVLYTDGVTEARGPDGMLGEDGLRAVLHDAAGASLDVIVDRIVEAAVTQRGGSIEDDIAVVAAGITKRRPRSSGADPTG